ncbi:MAG TPA: alcohol dehydrogenase, partial [bacterium]|nr:alcohol dehydrogenase [bacterium]
MKAVRLHAKWAPKPGFKLGAKDVDGVQTYLGSLVWKTPKIVIEEVEIPEPGPKEVLIEVMACGICGSD